MYLVTLVGIPGSFFCDEDPSTPPSLPSSGGLFRKVEVAEFHDSYTPTSRTKEYRERDARAAFEEGSTRTTRINYKAVAKSVRV